MNNIPDVRPFLSSEWQIYKDLRLRALADSPNAFSRTLAEEQGRSDDEWVKRLEKGAIPDWDLPLFAKVAGVPAGIAWGHIETATPEIAHLYQVWVAPNYRGLGIGQMFLEAVISWAKKRNAKSLDLGVTQADSPAMRLYISAGFRPTGKVEALRPGSELLCQELRLDLDKAA
jgi:ribosomal protein S18 acetylase RimI-like enzyme